MAQKYLIISLEFPPFKGGIAKYAINLVKNLICDGNDVSVLTKRFPDPENRKNREFKVFYFPSYNNRILWKAFLLSGFLILTTILCKRNKFSHIIIVDPASAFLFPLVSGFVNVPFDIVLYGSELGRYQNSIFTRTVFRWALLKAGNLWCISRYTAEMLDQRYAIKNNNEVLRCGVEEKFLSEVLNQPSQNELRKRYNLEDTDYIIGTIARLVPRKGHSRVIEALPELLKQIPNIKYLIVGVGESAEYLKEHACSFGVEQIVIFTGEIEEQELIAHYDLLNLYVMLNTPISYTIEGFGISFIEAAARGVPSIGCENGGVSEAISERISGLLIQSADKEEFISRVVEIFCNPSDWDAVKMKEFARQFSWRKITSKIISQHQLDEPDKKTCSRVKE